MNPQAINPQVQAFLASKGYTPPASSKTGGWYSQITAPKQAPTNPIADQFNQGVEQVKEAGSDILSGKENPIQAAESGLSAESGLATAVAAPLAPVMKPIGAAVNAAGNIGNTLADLSEKLHLMSPEQRTAYNKANADFANSDSGKTIERIATDLSNAGNVAGTISGFDQVVKGAPKVANAAKDFAENMKTTPEEIAANTEASDTAKVKEFAEDWQKGPNQKGVASFNKAKDILSQDPTIPQFLAEQKANPYGHIENGKYATADTANAFRETAGKISKDTLRPALEAADYYTPKTNIAEVKVPEKLIQAQGRGVTPDDVEAIKAKIQSKLDALGRKYPNGMGLTDMHDEKITYAQNGKFSPVGDAATDNNAIANRSISSTLGDLVAKKAPSNIPVDEINAYAQKYYRAADYLDALDTKKVPTSVMENLLHKGAQLVGVGAGHFFGGGILADVAGYQIGGAIEHALYNLSSKARGAFLENLKVSDPEAFTKVQNYLNDIKSGNPGVLKLPAAGPETPILLGAPKETSNVAPMAAKAKLPVANPKTGRMTRVYTSLPK